MTPEDVLPAARYEIADLCALLSEPSRVAMLLALMDGSARPAGELARAARVSAQTASSHFGKLVAGGVLAVEQQGRHRYYRISNEELAHAIEALGVVRPPRRSPPPRPLEFARSCYHHLAGWLGVELRRQLELHGRLAMVGERCELTRGGLESLAPLLDSAAPLPPGKRCIDWTERQPHIGGALGSALLTALLEQRWLQRSAERRVLEVTRTGERGLRSVFGIDVHRRGTAPSLREALARAG
jgi:DNA-binding transcriptional ArsR family regulator